MCLQWESISPAKIKIHKTITGYFIFFPILYYLSLSFFVAVAGVSGVGWLSRCRCWCRLVVSVARKRLLWRLFWRRSVVSVLWREKKVSVLRQRPRKGKRRLWSAEVGFADGGWFWVVVADGVWVTVAHDWEEKARGRWRLYGQGLVKVATRERRRLVAVEDGSWREQEDCRVILIFLV